MKWSALFLSLLALPAFSSTGENHTFNITDSQGFDAVLNGQKTHTEYRTETHASTCYRTEIAGYRTVCTGGGYPYPYPAPGPYPRPYPGPGPGPGYCRQEPIYRTVPYTCYQQVQVPYEVFDYYTQAQVQLTVANKTGRALNEMITSSLNGDSLNISASSPSKSVFVTLKNKSENSQMNGNMKVITVRYEVEVTDATSVLAALTKNEMSIYDSVLTYTMGPKASVSPLTHSLKIVKAPIVGSNTVLFDRALMSSEISDTTVAGTTSATTYSIDFRKFGQELTGGRYLITMKSQYMTQGMMLLNANEFGEKLSKENTVIFKLR